MRRIAAGVVLFGGGAFTATVYWGKIFVKVKFEPWSLGDTLVLAGCAAVTWVVAWLVSPKKVASPF